LFSRRQEHAYHFSVLHRIFEMPLCHEDR
jgi:hypothetical protein